MISLEKRRCGVTTGGLLKALGEAVQNPKKEIVYIDHVEIDYPESNLKSLYRHCNDLLERWIKLLGLNAQCYINTKGQLCVISLHREMFLGSDGFMYQKMD